MQRHRTGLRVAVLISILLAFGFDAHFHFTGPARQEKSFRISTWYWLNSAPREEWDGDFAAVAKAGFTDLLLCWGLDATAPALQKANTRRALDLCSKNGLRAYLLVWHPTHNSLARQADFQQVDNLGNRLFSFNLFHKTWRATQWKQYLQEVAASYKHHPAFAGYLFDDSFGLGKVGSLNGDIRRERGDFVSYSPYDFAQFRDWLKTRHGSLAALSKAWSIEYTNWDGLEPPRQLTRENEHAWSDWCAARRDWLLEWSKETVASIREIDPDPDHEIYLEDTYRVLGLVSQPSKYSFRPVTIRDTVGLDFGAVTRPFDAICGYTYFSWEGTDALQKAQDATRETLRATRSQAADTQKIIYTFWVADVNVDKPLPVEHPTADEIIAIAKTAASLGVRHVDYYGFRIGEWRVTDDQWLRLRPGSEEAYPIVESIQGVFLRDRPQVLKELAAAHRRLRDRSN